LTVTTRSLFGCTMNLLSNPTLLMSFVLVALPILALYVNGVLVGLVKVNLYVSVVPIC